jgi:NAD(P)H-dependent flavin oxidoreductase YrpB (nitropropane dioxygenase family)
VRSSTEQLVLTGNLSCRATSRSKRSSRTSNWLEKLFPSKKVTICRQYIVYSARGPDYADAPRPDRLGIGFMGWKFEAQHLPADQGAQEGDKWLRYIIHGANARSIWISFAVDLKHWVDRARKIETEAPTEGNAAARTTKEKLLIVIMVHSADKAKEVMTWPGIDAIVLQGSPSPSLRVRRTSASLCLELTRIVCDPGTEAGGHGADFDSGASLASLLNSVLALKSHPASAPLILAAGGISSPQAVSELLSHEGVAAVVTGTALCVADESTLSGPQKKLLVEAEDGETSTARSLRWDVARGTTGWPAGVDGRGLRDQTSEGTGEVQKGGPPVTWAGTSGLAVDTLENRLERLGLEGFCRALHLLFVTLEQARASATSPQPLLRQRLFSASCQRVSEALEEGTPAFVVTSAFPLPLESWRNIAFVHNTTDANTSCAVEFIGLYL